MTSLRAVGVARPPRSASLDAVTTFWRSLVKRERIPTTGLDSIWRSLLSWYVRFAAELLLRASAALIDPYVRRIERKFTTAMPESLGELIPMARNDLGSDGEDHASASSERGGAQHDDSDGDDDHEFDKEEAESDDEQQHYRPPSVWQQAPALTVMSLVLQYLEPNQDLLRLATVRHWHPCR